MHISRNCDGLVNVVAKQQKRVGFMLPKEWKSKMAAKSGIPKIVGTSANNTTLTNEQVFI